MVSISDGQFASAAAAADAESRHAMFRESPLETAERIALGLAWRMTPKRIAGLPELVGLHLKEWLRPSPGLPDPEATLARVPNVCGIAHDLQVPTLVAAYARGIYPLSHVLAPKWLSPPQRCVLFYRDYHISKRFRPHIRQARFRVTFDRAFAQVIKACAARRSGRPHLTWITPRMMHAYADLHDAGYAHSFEVWNAAGELVGGGYGVSVGRTYALESMFCVEDNSSKIGFTFLNWHLERWGFLFTDNKALAPYKLQLGFKAMPRAEFLGHLATAVQGPSKLGRWDVEADAATVAAWQPGRAASSP